VPFDWRALFPAGFTAGWRSPGNSAPTTAALQPGKGRSNPCLTRNVEPLTAAGLRRWDAAACERILSGMTLCVAMP